MTSPINNNRTNKSIKNIFVGLICQLGYQLFNFITRYFLINYIGVEIVGLNSVFANIISIVSVAELGFSTIILIDMYKPIIDDDKVKLKALLDYYKKIYNIIGCIVLILGILVMPFLPLIVDASEIVGVNIYLAYLLVLLNTVSGYYMSYKKSIIIADQKNYLVEFNKFAFLTIKNIILILLIINTTNYYLYLIIQPIFTLLENFFISKLATKKYKEIFLDGKVELHCDDKKEITVKVKSLMIHKVCDAFVLSTDNILISIFLGVTMAGFFANYNIILALGGILAVIIVQQISSSVGNLLYSADSQRSEFIFDKIIFINFILIGLLSIGMISLTQDFIKLWLGEVYVLSNVFLFLLVASFYVRYSRESAALYKNSIGLFVKDKYIPIIKVFLNLIISIILLIVWGLNGVLIGTIVSILLTNVVIEPIIVYKYIFKKSSFGYFLKYITYTIVSIVVCVIVYIISNNINVDNYFDFIVKCFIVASISLLLYSVIYSFNSQFRYILKSIFDRIKK